MKEIPISQQEIPETLTFYRGGLNVGPFYPGPPVYIQGSDVTGNKFTGRSNEYRARGDGEGEKRYAGWMLILAPTDITITIKNSKERIITQMTSLYDGYYNRDQLPYVSKRILPRYTKGGYADWYIPSIDELAFINKNLPIGFDYSPRVNLMEAQSYLSSTYSRQNVVLGNTKKTASFLFAQSFRENTYGDTFLVSDTKPMPVRLVRRVPIYTI